MSGRRETRTSTSHCITFDQLSLHQTSSVRVQIEFLYSILPWLPSVATCSHVLGPTIDWATNTWQSQNSQSVRLISGVLVAIVARWKTKKIFLFSGLMQSKIQIQLLSRNGGFIFCCGEMALVQWTMWRSCTSSSLHSFSLFCRLCFPSLQLPHLLSWRCDLLQ